jgi:hypothetical protein
MTNDRLPSLLREAVPPLGPAIRGEVIIQAAIRRRGRARAVVASVAVLVTAVAVTPFLGANSTRRPASTVEGTPGPVHRPVLPQTATPGLPGRRILAAGTLVQLSGGSLGNAMHDPLLEPAVTRLYTNGLVLGPDETREGYLQAHLTSAELRQARDLVVEAGLDQGSLDYGTPTHSGFEGGQTGFQVPGAPDSVLVFGGTVNGVASSTASLSAEQLHARAALAELTALLRNAIADGTAYLLEESTRYARSFSTHPPAIPQTYPAWRGPTPLDQGPLVAAYTHCTGVQSKTEPATPTGDYRWEGKNWRVLYQPVLPGESACRSRATSVLRR